MQTPMNFAGFLRFQMKKIVTERFLFYLFWEWKGANLRKKTCKRFSAAKCSYFALILHETFVSANGESYIEYIGLLYRLYLGLYRIIYLDRTSGYIAKGGVECI